MIGGHDIVFRTESSAQVAEAARRVILRLWPKAVVENAETGELLSTDWVGELPSELLIYKNSDARDSWTANGAIPENANSMVHIIRGTDSITVVVDEPHTGDMPALLSAMRECVYQDVTE